MFTKALVVLFDSAGHPSFIPLVPQKGKETLAGRVSSEPAAARSVFVHSPSKLEVHLVGDTGELHQTAGHIDGDWVTEKKDGHSS